MDINGFIQTVAVYGLPVLFALSLHEAAHAYAANFFGDPTAAEEGHLNLNPVHHISPLGTIILPLCLIFFGYPPAGFGKPVPVEVDRLRSPKRHSAYVSAAGPAANFAMGLGWMVLWVVLTQALALDAHDFFVKMAEAGVATNSLMIVINLIPVPPLDGGGILMGLVPDALSRRLEWFDRHAIPVIIGLLVVMQFRPIAMLIFEAIYVVQRVFHALVKPLMMLLS